MNIKISSGNSKMGKISSISLPAVLTCRDGCLCKKKCYSLKLERLRPSVKNAYYKNYYILKETPDVYWRELEGVIMTNRYFRFHVSGDIPDSDYLKNMINISYNNPHCEILCFTKQYEMVNEYIQKKCKPNIPENLHIILSVWDGIKCDNPYNLPEAHVRYRDGHTTARKDAKECSGNCTDCAIVNSGCWTIKNGEQIIFNEH